MLILPTLSMQCNCSCICPQALTRCTQFSTEIATVIFSAKQCSPLVLAIWCSSSSVQDIPWMVHRSLACFPRSSLTHFVHGRKVKLGILVLMLSTSSEVSWSRCKEPSQGDEEGGDHIYNVQGMKNAWKRARNRLNKRIKETLEVAQLEESRNEHTEEPEHKQPSAEEIEEVDYEEPQDEEAFGEAEGEESSIEEGDEEAREPEDAVSEVPDGA